MVVENSNLKFYKRAKSSLTNEIEKKFSVLFSALEYEFNPHMNVDASLPLLIQI